MSEHPTPAEPHAPADAPTDDRLAAYATALGVDTPDAAARLADALRQRAGGNGASPLAALDAFLDELAARVADAPPDDDDDDRAPDGGDDTEARRSPAAVRFTLARHLGPLLSAHPAAPADADAADAFAAALAHHHDALPGGVLPTHPHQEMPRQPLGALPAVLRSQFWTSAYRFGPFGNRRNTAAAPDSPRPTGIVDPVIAAAPTPAARENPA